MQSKQLTYLPLALHQKVYYNIINIIIEVINMTKTMKVNRWGDALGIRLPSEFVKAVGLKEKNQVEMTIRNDEIIIRKAPELLSLKELISNCPEWDGNPPDRYEWGEPQGRETL